MNKKNTLEGADENTLETHLHLKHLADAGFLKTEPQSVAPGPFWRERELLMDTQPEILPHIYGVEF